MNKIKTALFTFVDEETGEFADVVAPNEATARLRLGGDWILSERCPLLAQPASVENWDSIVMDAQDEAQRAFAGMNAARPKPGTIASMEAIKAFNEATVTYERKRARVTGLIEMSLK